MKQLRSGVSIGTLRPWVLAFVIESVWYLQVEDPVDEGSIEHHTRADGSCDELEGPEEVFVRQLMEIEVPFFLFCVQGPVAGFVAEAAGFEDEEGVGASLVEDKDIKEEDCHHEDACDLLRPQ